MEKLREIIRESFEDSAIVIIDDCKLQDYEGYDSLTAMMLSDAFQECFEITIDVERVGDFSLIELQNKYGDKIR